MGTLAQLRQSALTRLVRSGGFLSLLVLTTWMASRFQVRSFWPTSLTQIAGIVVWAIGLHSLVRLVGRLTERPGEAAWPGYARSFALLLGCGLSFLWYFNAHRVGPIDAQWYQNMTTDFLTQARAGTFPVTVGSTLYAFNGAVHPFRSAPWQFVLADGVDLLSGRSLAPVAVEHLTAIISYIAAVLILYVGFVRARPLARRWAFAFALGYAMAPAATVPFFQYDMYMTLTAQPVMVATLLCVQSIAEDDFWVSWGWLGVCLAAVWYCHPPMALMTNLVAGSCVAMSVAVRGVSVRRLAGGALALALFAALAIPYFQSMAELSHSDAPRLQDVVAPALGLGFILFAVAGFLRTGWLPWLGLLPTGLACLHAFKPALLPFAAAFAGLVIVARPLTAGRTRRLDGAWLMVSALLAGLIAVYLFPRLSFPDPAGLAGMRSEAAKGGALFRSMVFTQGSSSQPGDLLWFLLAGMIVLGFWSRSLFAQCVATAAVVLLAAWGLGGGLSVFLWQNTPSEITEVIGIAYDLRLTPVLAVLAVTGGFFWFTSVQATSPRLGRWMMVLTLLLLPRALWQHVTVLHNVKGYQIDAVQTAIKNRSENVALERYSWDLLPPPRFLNYGVMDPRLETRFWSDRDRENAAIGPDEIERAEEMPRQVMTKVTATPIPTGKQWLTLDPTIELDPGQNVILRFDFLGKNPTGYLIVRGQTIYREYLLPSSGRDYAFGSALGNTRTLSLWNSGSTHESIVLLILRTGQNAFDPPGPNPYCLLSVEPFDPARSPIELYSLTPLHLRVNAPTPGYVETFRSWIPGYKAYVDDKLVPVHDSKNGLVSVRVPAGVHDLHVRFAGTVNLHTAIRLAETFWILAVLALFLQVAAMVRRPVEGV